MSNTSSNTSKINNIPMHDIEDRMEQRWFSTIKHLASQIHFGKLECDFIIKNGKIVSVRKKSGEETYNIGRF